MTLKERFKARSRPLIMHPAIFVGSFLLVSLLFATQQWVAAEVWYPRMKVRLLVVASGWAVQYLVWAVCCWTLWFWIGPSLQKANWSYLLMRMLPLSVVLSVGVEMVLAAAFPQFPLGAKPMTFLERLDFGLTDEFLGNMTIFWSVILALRALGYYEESREKERALSQLAVELTQAQMQALRMQINPHFLFNTMNSISSLMQTDVRAADSMLEQLSSMLRITLERGSKQLIRMGEEFEFIELYLALQERRYAGRVHQSVSIEPQLYDALVPAMLLQPLVENAYVHGLSRINTGGILEIEARRDRQRLLVTVRNNGTGLRNGSEPRNGRMGGVGLTNIKNRLQLHFKSDQSLEIREVAPNMVQVEVSIPLVFSDVRETTLVGYGAS
ncbi:MAG TPA: histidine kinase [Terracidiphilus sp.]|nr:histidine kinase [Terracidiphilus sp.]